MAGISVQARKAKGRKHQQDCAKAILARFPDLTPDDVRSCSMGSGGADLLLSSAAKAAFPYEVECKKRASGYSSLYDDLDQAKGHGDLTPILMLRQDHKKETLVVMTEAAFLDLAKRARE